VATGGALAAGAYTVTLRGDRTDADGFAARGLRTATGGTPLAGNGAAAPAGDYTGTFTVSAFTGPVATLADFARGPGQAAQAPNASAGRLPVTLSTGTGGPAIGVDAVDLELRFDPALLQLKAAVRGAALPADATVSVNIDNTAGVLRVAIFRAVPFSLAGTALELLQLDAEVPASAP
jgi:hypothetical protein